jgi:hypothetical protein
MTLMSGDCEIAIKKKEILFLFKSNTENYYSLEKRGDDRLCKLYLLATLPV